MSQLALPLQLADHAVFESFLDSGNETLVATLKDIASAAKVDTAGYGCWLWGAPSSGKTHLLQAVCAAAGDDAVYLPLSILKDSDSHVLDGLASRALLCVDDIDAVVGQDSWELALFDLLNQAADVGTQLVVSARTAPRECAALLADLKSRFVRLPVFHLHVLDENARMEALQLRSRHRGLELPDETARYLLNRSRRDMASLYSLLDRLDREALRAKRRLTIPFVRGVLEDGAV